MLNMRFRLGLALLFVGLAFLGVPPYKQYCEGAYANQKDCAPYEMVASLGTFLEVHNAIIAAIATVAIAYFTWTIREVNKSQLVHARQVDRAYLWPGFGKSYLSDDKQRRTWRIRVWNSGKTVGILQTVYHALVPVDDFNAGKIRYKAYRGREDVLPPSVGEPNERETGIEFETYATPMVSCGWIVYEDIFGDIQRQGWKHTLNLMADPAGNVSIPFRDCYSRAYAPWKGAEISDEQE
jgi:hypothetical protein